MPLASSEFSSKRASTDFACSLTVACARRHACVYDCTAAQQRSRLLRLNIRVSWSSRATESAARLFVARGRQFANLHAIRLLCGRTDYHVAPEDMLRLGLAVYLPSVYLR